MGRQRTRMTVDERRTQLLDLGKQLFADYSYDELSIDEIARSAGISKGLLYHYFPSKRDFYIASVRASAQDLVDLTAPDDSLMPAQRLRSGLDAYLLYVDERSVSYAALLRSGVGADRKVGDIVESTRQAFFTQLTMGIPKKKIPAPLRIAIRGWIGFVEGASLDWIDHRDISRDHLRDMLIEILNDALALARNEDGDEGTP